MTTNNNFQADGPKNPASDGHSGNENKRGWYVPLVFVICCFLLVRFVMGTHFGKSFEYKSYDWRIALRNRPAFSGIQAQSHTKNPDIVIVPVDDKTLEKIKDPMIFWGPYFGKVFDALTRNGALVTGLDYTLDRSFDEYLASKVEEINRYFFEEIDLKLEPDILDKFLPHYDDFIGRSILSGNIVLVAVLNKDGQVEIPFHKFFYAAMARQNIGLPNVEPDSDGIVRRQFLYKTGEFMDSGQMSFYSFSLVMAKNMLDAEIAIDGKTGELTINGKMIPHDPDYNIITNYIGPTGCFIGGHSFSDLVERAEAGDDEFFVENFAGKAVLIGPAHTGSLDIVLTPYNIDNKLEMYGVEVHANIINTIVNNDYIIPSTPLKNDIILLIMGIIIGFICYYSKPQHSLVFSTAAGMVFIALCFFELYRNNSWINMAGPLMMIPLTYGAVYTYRYIVEDREKRFIRKVLGRYISESVAKEILKDPSKLALGGKRTEVTVLFCDINDFTTYSEKTSPEEVIAILNDYFTRMEKVIFEKKGTLKQFVGDEIMVISGAPQNDPDHAYRVCDIAVGMIRELKKWQEERSARGAYTFNVKFGIHSGEVVAGNVGSPNRTEYTTVGDVVNTASRIMGLTKLAGADILISQQTYDMIKEHFVVNDKGSYPVKGREEEVRVYELVERKKEN